ncbi:TPA: non-canonical purine NTP pyrophosphatase [Stenotrophomonas maltophilia]
MTDLWFLTTNAIKLANFRTLARGTGLSIHSFHERTFLASYYEPRLDDRQEILRLSYESALFQWNRAGLDLESFFFIEDTSVIIHALSGDREVPGVDVKYWMRDMDFPTLDELLKARGNDRAVTVRSDIILHLPPSIQKWFRSDSGYIQFTGETNGHITDVEHALGQNPLRPWQDSKSFNKWFVPNGCQVPFSALDPDSADQADFRRRAFEGLISFLSDIGIRSTNSSPPQRQMQMPGLPPGSPLLVICGLSGSGKTTIAEYLVNTAGYMHFEASDFMRCEYYERLGRSPSVRLSDFAIQVLDSEPWIIPEKIMSAMEGFGDFPIVITGFRSEREVEHLLANCERHGGVEIVVVEARQNLRYARIRKRGRRDAPKSLRDLCSKDQEQLRMGVSRIRKNWPKIIKNNGSIYELRRNVRHIVPAQNPGKWRKEMRIATNELERSLIRAMGSISSTDGLTTTRIADLVNRLSIRDFDTHKDNVSRYFNQRFSPYFTFKLISGKGYYSLSQTGRSYLLALKASPHTNLKRAPPEKNERPQLSLPFPPAKP